MLLIRLTLLSFKVAFRLLGFLVRGACSIVVLIASRLALFLARAYARVRALVDRVIWKRRFRETLAGHGSRLGAA